MRVRFGPFVLDTERQEVSRGDQLIHLTPKALDLLTLLIERRPRVVSRQDLLDHLWPDVIVSPANLKNLASELRCALDDHERDGRFIRTIHGRGYGFTDRDLEILDSGTGDERFSDLKLLHEDRTYPLRIGENLIGRGGDCDLVVDEVEVSRHHARLHVTADGVTIEDLSSKNGTFVNGQRIYGLTGIADSDCIALGTVRMTGKLSSRDATTRSVERGEHAKDL